MELVDGDARSPNLISNLEVMQLLRKNIDEREKNSNRKREGNKRNKQFRHRDWVEEEVHNYLQSTPCVKLDPDKREEFHAKLKGRRNLRRPKTSTEEGTCLGTRLGEGATDFDLTEAEALQIMNMMPSQPVEIHLMVDELQSRMSETRQEEFLAFISSHSVGSIASVTQPMEIDDVPNRVNGQHENRKLQAVKVKKENSEEFSNNVI